MELSARAFGITDGGQDEFLSRVLNRNAGLDRGFALLDDSFVTLDLDLDIAGCKLNAVDGGRFHQTDMV